MGPPVEAYTSPSQAAKSIVKPFTATKSYRINMFHLNGRKLLYMRTKIIKKSPFLPSRDSDTAVCVADSFCVKMLPYHGIENSIVTDPTLKFKFWKRLMELIGVQLKMGTSRHPQTDGASLIMDPMVENYLRYYCYERPARRIFTFSPARLKSSDAVMKTAVLKTPNYSSS